MIAIGIGCRSGCSAADILALVAATAASLPAGLAADGVFSLVDKRGEPGLEEAAVALGLPLVFLERSVLAGVAGAAQTRSPRVDDMFGLPSVAETAALAGAGQGASLLVTRRSSRTASCAIAGPPR